jgi:hypothetical protein
LPHTAPSLGRLKVSSEGQPRAGAPWWQRWSGLRKLTCRSMARLRARVATARPRLAAWLRARRTLARRVASGATAMVAAAERRATHGAACDALPMARHVLHEIVLCALCAGRRGGQR